MTAELRERMAATLDEATSKFGTGFWENSERDALVDALIAAGFGDVAAGRAEAVKDALRAMSPLGNRVQLHGYNASETAYNVLSKYYYDTYLDMPAASTEGSDQ